MQKKKPKSGFRRILSCTHILNPFLRLKYFACIPVVPACQKQMDTYTLRRMQLPITFAAKRARPWTNGSLLLVLVGNVTLGLAADTPTLDQFVLIKGNVSQPRDAFKK